jgi:CMP-2-keto-3-deoxyoctulosonic acid synthetase
MCKGRTFINEEPLKLIRDFPEDSAKQVDLASLMREDEDRNQQSNNVKVVTDQNSLHVFFRSVIPHPREKKKFVTCNTSEFMLFAKQALSDFLQFTHEIIGSI